MKEQPLVSIIICFFNSENYFQETLRSVFEQTYENWQLLLVDDGSTDSSTQIAQQTAKQYPNQVRYLEHENHQNCGISASRNLGIIHATGDYIALLDADDIWLPEKLERQVAILESQTEVAMVYGSTLMWYSWAESAKDLRSDWQRAFEINDWQRVLGVQPDTVVQPPRLLTLSLQGKAHTPGTCAVLIRRKVVEEVGRFEESFTGMCDDLVFFAKILLNYPVFVESGCWDKYRQHADSICHISQQLGEYDPERPDASGLNYRKWLEMYLRESGFEGTEPWRALQRSLLPYRYSAIYGVFEPLYRQVRFQWWRIKRFTRKLLGLEKSGTNRFRLSLGIKRSARMLLGLDPSCPD